MPPEHTTIAARPRRGTVLVWTPRVLVHPTLRERCIFRRALAAGWPRHAPAMALMMLALGLMSPTTGPAQGATPAIPPGRPRPLLLARDAKGNVFSTWDEAWRAVRRAGPRAQTKGRGGNAGMPRNRVDPALIRASTTGIREVDLERTPNRSKKQGPGGPETSWLGLEHSPLAPRPSPLAPPGGPETSWLGLELLGGRYLVTETLGESGSGVVYRARDRQLGGDVAIEVPRCPSLVEGSSSARFVRAIRTLARRTHPHLVKIRDVGMSGDVPFVVAEYPPGGSLACRRRVGPDGLPAPMDPGSLADWLPDLAEALDFLHAQGRIHRDVRPVNILFDARGQVFLGGLAMGEGLAESSKPATGRTSSDAGSLTGPFGYLAPEQLLGRPIDGRADQYALAVIVFEWLGGRRPFDGPIATAVLVRQATSEPPALREICPTIPEPVSAVVRRGLSRDPESRFPDCASFARAVLAAMRGEPVSPIRPEPTHTGRDVPERTAAATTDPAASPGRSHWIAVMCSATIVAVCVLGPRRTVARSWPWPPALLGRAIDRRALKALGPPSTTRAGVPAKWRHDIPRAEFSTEPAEPEPPRSRWWLGPSTPPPSLRRYSEARRRTRSAPGRVVGPTSRP
ncbi:MAG: serine/threonine protein kinase [Planctomycetaceae bacterium]|nr:serine/threonine protein kinase [Planctomycetaceae bacterium]